MSIENKFENFKASDVRLEGSNLIEASAGTGKTYSIAILVLRLVIEERFSLREILMVTFTKAAVAELEERIRLFMRSAYKVSNNEKIEDKTITDLVNNSIKNNGRDEVVRILREAVIYLDETSVLTIHSFCQQTLIEFAFETNQLFGIELLQDVSAIIEEEVNKFWRKNITSINTGLLAYLLDAGLSRAAITDIVQEHLNGKRFHVYENLKDYTFCGDDHLNLIKEIVPTVKTIGVPYNPGEANAAALIAALQEMAPEWKVEIVTAAASKSADVQGAAQSLVGKVDVIYVPTDNTIVSALEAVIAVGTENKIPVFSGCTRKELQTVADRLGHRARGLVGRSLGLSPAGR